MAHQSTNVKLAMCLLYENEKVHILHIYLYGEISIYSLVLFEFSNLVVLLLCSADFALLPPGCPAPARFEKHPGIFAC